MQETTIPVESLRAAGYGDEVEAVGTAVADFLDDGVGSNVAVVSEPYAGRGALLDYAESLLEDDVHRVSLTEAVDPDDVPSFPETGALLVENCHHLYRRCIDGFAPLDAFLEDIALTDRLVVTTWNRHAWAYLEAVRDVADSFPVEVEIPPLSAAEIEAVLDARDDEERPTFVDAGHAGRIKTVVFDSVDLGLWGDRTLSVPYPKPNTAWLATWGEDDSDVSAVVYEKLRRLSHGNPGVAAALWDRSVQDGEIAPGYVQAPEAALSLDDDAAFLLWAVVTNERVHVDTLSAVLGDRSFAADLEALDEEGVVAVDGDYVTVEPEALHRTAAALERRGLLW